MTIDIEANRKAVKWTPAEQVGRVLWALCRPLFRWSPRPCRCWRNNLLRLFGAKVGRRVHVDPSARIWIPWKLTLGDDSAVGFDALLYNLGPLTIGPRATVSQRAHLCGGTHDFRGNTMELVKAPITIEEEAWVCADAFVGPGVTVGKRAVVGARAVAVKDVEPGTIVAGNPCSVIGKR